MNVVEILRGISQTSALVIGDVCLDRWCTYDPETSEPSRETGIPRIGVVRTECTPGAGGTVANNLVALGAKRVAVIGVIGNDGHGAELRKALNSSGIEAGYLVTVDGRQTFTYTKFINNQTSREDLPRVDFVSPQPLPAEVEDQVIANIEQAVPSFDAVLISDQMELDSGGTVTDRVRACLHRCAREFPKKIFWVDSRRRIHEFHGMIVKPNEDEAQNACHSLFGRVDYRALQKHCDAPALVVTLGGDGALVLDREQEQRIPAMKNNDPVDICGAGDSFSAGAALSLHTTKSILDAVHFGNLVASITIQKRGTGQAYPDEISRTAAGNPDLPT